VRPIFENSRGQQDVSGVPPSTTLEDREAVS
jgi:hypothetical protein